MNFLFYFINIYYTVTFKYFFLAFICLFIILFIFYKQIDYFFLTKITYLTNITTFKYIDVFDIFFSNFKINFLILFFLLSSISPIYIYIDQKLCVALKFNKIIKYICLSVIVLNNIIIYIYINYICVLYFKILLSYQIQINQNNSNFFLGFDLYLANFINFWILLCGLLFFIFLITYIHCIGCYIYNLYYFYNKLFYFIWLFILIILLCNSLVVDFFAFCLYYLYFMLIYYIIFIIYQLFIYKYYSFK